jgi:hypothetical protein
MFTTTWCPDYVLPEVSPDCANGYDELIWPTFELYNMDCFPEPPPTTVDCTLPEFSTHPDCYTGPDPTGPP